MLSTGNADLDAALAEAITSRRRRLVWSLTADLGRTGAFDHPWSDLSGLISEVTVNRALAGDLPAETTLVEGFASAALTATLEGRIGSLDVIDLFGAYRGNPQWAGVALRFDLGLDTRLGPIMLRQFTGTIRAVTTHASARTVTLTAADGAETLRAAVTLPVSAVDGLSVARAGEDQFGLWGNTQWVIDTVLRRNGLYNSPPPVSGCVFSATLHGSLAPEIGYGGSPQAENPVLGGQAWITGPFGLLAANGGGTIPFWGSSYVASVDVPVRSGTGIGMGLWLHHGAGAVLAADQPQAALFGLNPGEDRSQFLVIAKDGTLALWIVDAGTTYTLAHPQKLGSPGWRYVGVHVRYEGSASTINAAFVTWNVGGTITSDVRAVNMVSGRGIFPRAVVELFVARPVGSAQAWVGYQAPAAGSWPTTATSTADIDVGLGQLTHLPVVVGRDSWEVLKEVAGAEFAAVGFTEEGRFFFTNRDTLTTRRSAPPTSTIDANVLKDVAATTSMDAVRNEITLAATPAYTGELVTVFAATAIDEWVVPANSSIVRDVTVPEDTVTVSGGVYSPVPYVPTAQWRDDVISGFTPSQADGTGATDPPGVYAAVTQLDGTHAQVDVTNTNPYPVRLATSGSSPRPALHIQGVRLAAQVTRTDTVTDSASITTNRRRSLAITATPWRHRLDPLRALARKLLTELAAPRPVFDEIPVVGDPRRTLLDTLTLADTEGIGTTTASVVAITRRLSATEGLTDQLTVRPTT